MSYARWGDGSNVYIYADYRGGVVCCGCPLNIGTVQVTYTDFFGNVHQQGEQEWFGDTLFFYDVDSLIEHLREHLTAGYEVPGYLFDRSTYEMSDFDRSHEDDS